LQRTLRVARFARPLVPLNRHPLGLRRHTGEANSLSVLPHQRETTFLRHRSRQNGNSWPHLDRGGCFSRLGHLANHGHRVSRKLLFLTIFPARRRVKPATYFPTREGLSFWPACSAGSKRRETRKGDRIGTVWRRAKGNPTLMVNVTQANGNTYGSNRLTKRCSGHFALLATLARSCR
jgi:hypothetical protein